MHSRVAEKVAFLVQDFAKIFEKLQLLLEKHTLDSTFLHLVVDLCFNVFSIERLRVLQLDCVPVVVTIFSRHETLRLVALA